MNETPTNGPLPSKHVFLHELASLPGASKVRFVGCVLDYDVYTASLFLEHNFPRCEVPTPTASVDIRLVLETIKAEALQRGSWLNIIGYVRKPEQRRKKASSSTSDVTTAAVPLVQAIVIWAAGAIKIADYEATVVGQRALRHEVDFHAAT